MHSQSEMDKKGNINDQKRKEQIDKSRLEELEKEMINSTLCFN